MDKILSGAILAIILGFAVPLAALGDDLERAYVARVRLLAHGAGAARADGYIWAYDSAQLLRFAAVDRDETRYLEMRSAIVKRFVIVNRSSPEALFDVAWRVRGGEPADASGTTEALAVADALLIGAQTFHRPEDRGLAQKLVASYMRHQTTEDGIWFIRNYFNFATHAYATNSYIVDYLPDVQAAAGDQAGARLAYEVLERAMSPTGLFYEIIQPEVETAFPGENVAFFSPNSVTSIANSCAVALYAVSGRPDLARRVLAFGVAHVASLRRFYDERSGTALSKENAGTPAFACLTRLANRLHDETSRSVLDAPLRANAQTQLASGQADASTATAVLFALRRSDW